jgi:hypothetical protein
MTVIHIVNRDERYWMWLHRTPTNVIEVYANKMSFKPRATLEFVLLRR